MTTEPKASTKARDYTVLSHDPEDDLNADLTGKIADARLWIDWGTFPGTTRDQALKKATKAHAALRKEGTLIRCEPNPEILTREVEKIEREKFKPATKGAPSGS